MNRFALRTCLLLAFSGPTAIAQDASKTETGAVGSTVPYPISESIEASDDVDPSELLAAVVKRMGGEKLDQRKGMEYHRIIHSVRGTSMAFWEKFRIRTDWSGEELRARVEEVTIDPANGKAQNVAYVMNGDDIFKRMGPSVMTSAHWEAITKAVYYNEVFIVLGPWLLQKAGVELAYDGVATVTTYEPQKYIEPDENGVGGYSDYQPATLTYHKLRAAMPDEFAGTCGDVAELWITMGDEPEVAQMRFLMGSRPYVYGAYAPTLTIGAYQEVDGIRIPSEVHATVADNAERIEHVSIVNVRFDPEISELELERP